LWRCGGDSTRTSEHPPYFESLKIPKPEYKWDYTGLKFCHKKLEIFQDLVVTGTIYGQIYQ
ncbi:MAG: hypothetical protein PVH43_13555, partial [Desulfobacterales bacterium]